jgi:hypothetical protein
MNRMLIATLIAYAETVALPLDWLTAAAMGHCGKYLRLTTVPLQSATADRIGDPYDHVPANP